MSNDKVPLVFFQIFTATLIINSYISLRCGRGEMVKSDYYARYHEELVVFEKEHNFLQYGLIGFLLHTLFLIFPFFPFLILSASLSGMSLAAFGKACSLVFTASLLCRMFGFLMYLFWGRFRTIGYLLARTFLILFLFVTVVYVPLINPILILYELNKSLQNLDFPLRSSYSLYMAATMSAIVVIVIVNQSLIKHHLKSEK